MALTEELTKKVAEDIGVNIEDLNKGALIAFLRERKRKILLDRLDILKKYNVYSLEELRERIEAGKIEEHPVWEDIILLENLEESLAIIEEDIKAIQESS